MRSLEGPTNRLKVRIEEHTGKSYDEGVEVSMFSTIEIFFNVAIHVYSLQEDKIAKTVRISNLDYTTDNIIHLNLYQNHFLYIKKFKSYTRKFKSYTRKFKSYTRKFKSYTRKFQCLSCSRILGAANNLQRHIKKM